ncbi:MAG: phosphate ABC transporter substrate-binding protein [Oscillospiraceae bacterium]
MKKILSIVLASAMSLTLLTGCTSKTPTEKASPNPEASPAGEEISGTISTNGSTSMEKVISALSEAFSAKHPDCKITYDATGSGAGVTAAKEGMTDIGLASRNLKDEETGLEATIVAVDGIAIIVNNANPITDLTIEQISALVKGEAASWKDVGGNDAPVVVVGREAGSGTRDGFESIVKAEDVCKYDQELTSTGAVIAAVASNENAIGYASLSTVSDKTKTLTVGGIECTEETVLDGSYAIQRNFNFITKKDAVPSAAAKAFMEFALSDEAADIIAKAGAIQKK